jgi:hypothetical protein
MTKRTALVNATPKLIDQEAWVKEQPKPTTDEKVARLVVELPADLHRRLKGHCGLTGLKIKEVIQQLLEQYLADTHKDA